jgi:hypothetical protein
MSSTNDLINAVVTRLEDNLPALVTAESLTAITDYLNFEPILLEPSKSPLVWVDIEKDARSDDPSRGATLSKYSHDRTVLVGIYCNNQDPQTVTESLRAYADLVRKCLDGEQTAGGQGLWVRWLSSDFSPPTNVKMSVFREVVLSFDIPRRTSRGAD